MVEAVQIVEQGPRGLQGAPWGESKGEWAPGPYEKGDLVGYWSNIFRAIRNNNNPPATRDSEGNLIVSDDWEIIIDAEVISDEAARKAAEEVDAAAQAAEASATQASDKASEAQASATQAFAAQSQATSARTLAEQAAGQSQASAAQSASAVSAAQEQAVAALGSAEEAATKVGEAGQQALVASNRASAATAAATRAEGARLSRRILHQRVDRGGSAHKRPRSCQGRRVSDEARRSGVATRRQICAFLS